MSGYHSTELCYLAAVYTNLLITKQPLDLHFKPRSRARSKDRILRVSPDILPPGSIKIDQVWIDGQPWTEFDAEQADGHAAAAGGKDRRREGPRSSRRSRRSRARCRSPTAPRRSCSPGRLDET